MRSASVLCCVGATDHESELRERPDRGEVLQRVECQLFEQLLVPAMFELAANSTL